MFAETCTPIESVIPDFTNTTIDHGRILLLEIIGEGSYGVVYRAVSTAASSSRHQTTYAVKILVKAEQPSREWIYQQREIVTHCAVSEHRNIVTVHQVIEDDWFIYMVLDYCPGGDLFHAVCNRPIYCNNDVLIKKVFVQMLDAVQACHNQNVFHRDLKPDNFFCNEDGTTVVLGDFGLATDVDISTEFRCGSTYYMSPECIGEDYHYRPFSNRASDVWALGIILVNLVAGRNPWNHASLNDHSFLRFLASPDYLTHMLPISHHANKIFMKIFTLDPETRVSIRDLRTEILKLDTFFMTDEELFNASHFAKTAAHTYGGRVPVVQTVWPSSTAEASTEAIHQEDVTSLTSSDLSSSFSSRGDSVGLFTPKTLAHDSVHLASVPELAEDENVRRSALDVLTKRSRLFLFETKSFVRHVARTFVA